MAEAKIMGRKKLHETPADKVAASRNRWKVTNDQTGVTNKRFEVWIPNTQEDMEKVQALAAELRRNAGTTVTEDLLTSSPRLKPGD